MCKTTTKTTLNTTDPGLVTTVPCTIDHMTHSVSRVLLISSETVYLNKDRRDSAHKGKNNALIDKYTTTFASVGSIIL